MIERLQKYLAGAGVDSRRKCETLILEGAVEVNHKIVTELGTKIDPQNDLVKVNGKTIKSFKQKKLTYVLLNKPVGYLTTLSDPQNRPTIMDLVEDINVRIHPIGRLDYYSEGLLILSNDGDLTYHLTHPSKGIEKTYIAELKGNPEEEKLDRLRKGVTLWDNYKIMPCKINRIKVKKGNAVLKIKIKEGKKRQIRRMGEFIRHRVIKLKRIQMGPILLGNLKTGKYRELNDNEIRKLKMFCQTKNESV